MLDFNINFLWGMLEDKWKELSTFHSKDVTVGPCWPCSKLNGPCSVDGWGVFGKKTPMHHLLTNLVYLSQYLAPQKYFCQISLPSFFLKLVQLLNLKTTLPWSVHWWWYCIEVIKIFSYRMNGWLFFIYDPLQLMNR